jgi:hypothetical protein
MDVWANVDRSLERLHAADRFYEELLDLQHSLSTNPASVSAKEIIDVVAERLSAVVNDAKGGTPD